MVVKDFLEKTQIDHASNKACEVGTFSLLSARSQSCRGASHLPAFMSQKLGNVGLKPRQRARKQDQVRSIEANFRQNLNMGFLGGGFFASNLF